MAKLSLEKKSFRKSMCLFFEGEFEIYFLGVLNNFPWNGACYLERKKKHNTSNSLSKKKEFEL